MPSPPSPSKSRVVLVTGCSSGIGHALVLELLRRQCIVYAGSRRLEAMSDLAAQGAKPVSLDVASRTSCQDAVATVIHEQGRIDILVNNAGIGGTGPLLEFDIDAAEEAFRTNTLAPLRLAQLVSHSMIEQKSGIIVNIGSVVGEIPTAWSGIYNATKAALHSISRTLDLEVSGFGIRVLLVAAGGVKSGFGDQQTRSFKIVENSKYKKNIESVLFRATAGQTTSIPAEDFAKRLCDKVVQENTALVPRYTSFGGRAFSIAILRWLPWFVTRYFLMRLGGCNNIGRE